MGFRSNILLRTGTDFRSAVASNPFSDAIPEPKALHFFFLDAKPESPDVDGIAELAIPGEPFQRIDAALNLFELLSAAKVGVRSPS